MIEHKRNRTGTTVAASDAEWFPGEIHSYMRFQPRRFFAFAAPSDAWRSWSRSTCLRSSSTIVCTCRPVSLSGMKERRSFVEKDAVFFQSQGRLEDCLLVGEGIDGRLIEGKGVIRHRVLQHRAAHQLRPFLALCRQDLLHFQEVGPVASLFVGDPPQQILAGSLTDL